MWRGANHEGTTPPAVTVGNTMDTTKYSIYYQNDTRIFFASMANIPYYTRHSLKRWQKVIGVLIMKKEDDCRVHQTQPIPLKEADVNKNTKRMAKDASIIADKYNLLAAKQHGKLHGNVIHLATTKRPTYDISRKMKLPMVVWFNNARSCYDRIVHMVAFLDLRWIGIPKPMIVSMLPTI